MKQSECLNCGVGTLKQNGFCCEQCEAAYEFHLEQNRARLSWILWALGTGVWVGVILWFLHRIGAIG